MPIIGADQDVDYLRRQVLTSRNVRGGMFTDLLLGGLNYQIEHHLFPNMPRASLRRARPVVRAYCAELRIPYCETSLIGSYAAALRHLNTLGAPLRAASRTNTGPVNFTKQPAAAANSNTTEDTMTEMDQTHAGQQGPATRAGRDAARSGDQKAGRVRRDSRVRRGHRQRPASVATIEPWCLMTRWAWCIYGDPRPLLVTRWRWYARWCTVFDAMTYVCPWQR
jgi:hypothetical protein